MLNWLERIILPDIAAVICGYLDEYDLYVANLRYDYITHTSNLHELTAARGHLNILKWLHNNGCDATQNVCIAISARYHVNILDFLHDNNYAMGFKFYNYISKYLQKDGNIALDWFNSKYELITKDVTIGHIVHNTALTEKAFNECIRLRK